jgi:hypothetical protein
MDETGARVTQEQAQKKNEQENISLKKFITKLLPILDVLLSPLVYVSARIFKFVRAAGNKLPRCRGTMIRVGVFPVRNHYYEPQFDFRETRRPFSQDRVLPGVDWNIEGQLNLISQLDYAKELAKTPLQKSNELEFYMNNGAFEAGDAEYWYNLIRSRKPSQIFEIGSGFSTLMAINAIRANQMQDVCYKCKHVCIEPYEMPWLEKTNVSVIRQKVEDLPIEFFSELGKNDILFIDSSHMIRPQGDVLFEFLELLPTLKKGVIVHVHDIFSPKNYPKQWLGDDVKFWNEQYLLEAFLSHNRDWKIIGALNYLKHAHYDKLKCVAPFLTPVREPGSFYIQKVV